MLSPLNNFEKYTHFKLYIIRKFHWCLFEFARRQRTALNFCGTISSTCVEGALALTPQECFKPWIST